MVSAQPATSAVHAKALLVMEQRERIKRVRSLTRDLNGNLATLDSAPESAAWAGIIEEQLKEAAAEIVAYLAVIVAERQRQLDLNFGGNS